MNKLSLICAIMLSSLCIRTHASAVFYAAECKPETAFMPDKDRIHQHLAATNLMETPEEYAHIIENMAQKTVTMIDIQEIVTQAVRNRLFQCDVNNKRQLTIERTSDDRYIPSTGLVARLTCSLWQIGIKNTY